MPDPDLIISRSCIEIYGNNENDYCFLYSRETLKSFKFESNSQLTTIGKYAFYNCTKLQRIDLMSCTKLSIIKVRAFSFCTSATELFLPEGLKSIESYSFSNIKIRSVQIPSTVIELKKNAFTKAESLTSITFKEGSKLTSLVSDVFSHTSLIDFEVPESVQSISGAFIYKVISLTAIHVHPNNKYFVSDDCAVYSKNYTKIFSFAPNSTFTYVINSNVTDINFGTFVNAKCTSITIPPSVKYIGGSAFYETRNLKQIVLPPTLTIIEGYTFYFSAITSIDIPENVTKIEVGAFKACFYLNNILLPGNMTSIGGGAFPPNSDINITFKGNSSLKIDKQLLLMSKDNSSISSLLDPSATSIIIPSQTKIIRDWAFSSNINIRVISCDGISELEFIEANAFNGCNSLISIPYFPKLKQIAIQAFANTRLSSEFRFPSSFTLLHPLAFKKVTTLPSISFSSTSTSLTIKNSAFTGCTSLRSVSFEGCTCDIYIGINAFAGCSSLSMFNILKNFKNIDSGCFMNSGIKIITFEDNITSFYNLPSMFLKGCTNLNEIDIPKNIISIGSECFSGTSISHINIPESVESLYSQCFSYCINLEQVDIPFTCNLYKIFPEIFEGCTSLSFISDFSSDYIVCHNSTIYDKNFSHVYLHAPACKDNYISFDRRLKSVADSAFKNCIYIEFVVFVDCSVKSIGRHAFESCIRLKQISIPFSVSSIGEKAFFNCVCLKCGVLFQNKSKEFMNIIQKSGISNSALRSCEVVSCGIIQIYSIPVVSVLFTLFVHRYS
ncbi:surface antigen BspA-like [Trichomonas vaginalis G3]|uniref:Surface antigen BspA-like n=1 Tax=Trichomonas vaginalis (strain ATCC PRA-98 / G3) TaxID=412133 RepID=A2FUP8_TRIV3|nr:regulation of response to stimulus [Trichomonas vaginalis G3]EAX91365.1 surface antigen BspA-like [Trichomonas vaginalis G3]KAI5520088.1 regulation of response to stimulus [Trichomonas vaginalis G3]|eukprot:XP_001304295.1 surface antigen BspA-like [Trichomonas vaginalis G3]